MKKSEFVIIALSQYPIYYIISISQSKKILRVCLNNTLEKLLNNN